jgi:hypothetical protein
MLRFLSKILFVVVILFCGFVHESDAAVRPHRGQENAAPANAFIGRQGRIVELSLLKKIGCFVGGWMVTCVCGNNLVKSIGHRHLLGSVLSLTNCALWFYGRKHGNQKMEFAAYGGTFCELKVGALVTCWYALGLALSGIQRFCSLFFGAWRRSQGV